MCFPEDYVNSAMRHRDNRNFNELLDNQVSVTLSVFKCSICSPGSWCEFTRKHVWSSVKLGAL
jgi:hypothetical protein